MGRLLSSVDCASDTHNLDRGIRKPPAAFGSALELCLALAAIAGMGTHLWTSSTITNISAAVCTSIAIYSQTDRQRADQVRLMPRVMHTTDHANEPCSLVCTMPKVLIIPRPSC